MKHSLSGLCLIALVVQGCATYKTIEQETADVSDLHDRVVIFTPDGDGRDDGKGPVPHLKALGAPPKRVALVTFSVKSPAVKGSELITALSDSGARSVANAMKAKGFPALKEVFHKNGMEVLEPSEYLTDDSKKDFYKNFQVKVEGAASVLSGFLSATDGSGRMGPGEGVAEGYEMISDINAIWSFASVSNSIGGEMSKALGVDAVLIVTNEVGSSKDKAWLNNVNMYLFGPNPVPMKEEDLGTGMFKDNRSGHVFAGATIKKGFKDVYLLPKDADDLRGIAEEKNYNGYERIIESLAKVVAESTKARATEK